MTYKKIAVFKATTGEGYLFKGGYVQRNMAITTLYKSRQARYFVVDGISALDNEAYTAFLASYLQKRFGEKTVVSTEQPWREGIRYEDIMSNLHGKTPVPYDWFLQNRVDHLSKIVIPSLERGQMVVQRRGPYSTFAFIDEEAITIQNMISVHNRMEIPDAVFILQAPAQIVYERLARHHDARGHQLDPLQTVAALTNAGEKFLKMRDLFPRHPIHFVDVASGNEQEISRNILALLQPTLEGLVTIRPDSIGPIDIE